MRKLLVACVAVFLVLVGGLIALLRPQYCPVNRTAFVRIEKGMTKAEVHAILGGPPGDYRTRPTHPSSFVLGFGLSWTDTFDGDEGRVEVYYDLSPTFDERVRGGNFLDAEPYAPGVLELVRWRLRNLREAWRP